MKEYDVVIVGAGPAGMFAAFRLIESGKKLNILIIDEGKRVSERTCLMKTTGECINCTPCDIMCGVGGSGTFSDGTLNLRPDIGGDLAALTKDDKKAWDLIDYVDKVFLRFGAPNEIHKWDQKRVDELKMKSAQVGVKFIDIKQRHIGSDMAPKLIGNFEKELMKGGVEFLTRTKIADLTIENGTCKGVKMENGDQICGKYVVVAPGRVNAEWMSKIAKKNRIKFVFNPIDVGVRVEVPAIIMDPVTDINRDPKFHIWTTQYGDFVRTFCTNVRGFVVKENYGEFIGVNGHSMKNTKSENTNFAFLVRIGLTKPVEDTIRYGKSIAKLATTIGGFKPIVQRLGDLRRGRRSTWERLKRSMVVNTLNDVTPGNIAMALPHRILTDILEGLDKLNTIIPGVASDSTLLYAPETKFYSIQISVDKAMESSIKNLFCAGDGCGLSRDITNAAATGVLAANGILERIQEDNG